MKNDSDKTKNLPTAGFDTLKFPQLCVRTKANTDTEALFFILTSSSKLFEIVVKIIKTIKHMIKAVNEAIQNTKKQADRLMIPSPKNRLETW